MWHDVAPSSCFALRRTFNLNEPHTPYLAVAWLGTYLRLPICCHVESPSDLIRATRVLEYSSTRVHVSDVYVG